MSKEINPNSIDRLFGALTSNGSKPAGEGAPDNGVDKNAGSADTPKDADGKIQEQHLEDPGRQQDTAEKTSKRKKSSVERLCTYIDSDVMGKIRSISETESVSIKDIINASLKMSIANYETYHGKIRVHRQKKGNIDDVFHK